MYTYISLHMYVHAIFQIIANQTNNFPKNSNNRMDSEFVQQQKSEMMYETYKVKHF